MKVSQMIVIAALLGVSVAEFPPHRKHHMIHELLVQRSAPRSLAQLSDNGGKGSGELEDPVVAEKKAKVKEIADQIAEKTDPKEKSDTEKTAEFEAGVEKLAKEADRQQDKSAAKALEKEDEKLKEKEAEKNNGEEKEKPSKNREIVEEKLAKAEEKVAKDEAEKSQEKAEEKHADESVEKLKKQKAQAEADASKEANVIDKVRATIGEIVDPKTKPAGKTPKEEKDQTVQKFMKNAAEEAEKEEKRKEELEADAPKPNPAVEKVKDTEAAAGDAITGTIKEQVGERNSALKAAVKKQENAAATAKANSNRPTTQTAGSTPGHSSDEVWTANMPNSVAPEESFLAKKITAVIKK